MKFLAALEKVVQEHDAARTMDRPGHYPRAVLWRDQEGRLRLHQPLREDDLNAEDWRTDDAAF